MPGITAAATWPWTPNFLILGSHLCWLQVKVHVRVCVCVRACVRQPLFPMYHTIALT